MTVREGKAKMESFIEMERLFLREMDMNDFPALCRILGDSDIMRHYPYRSEEHTSELQSRI